MDFLHFRPGVPLFQPVPFQLSEDGAANVLDMPPDGQLPGQPDGQKAREKVLLAATQPCLPAQVSGPG